MGFGMNLKWKIRIKGKEYGSADAMPPAEREVYEKAIEELASRGRGSILAAPGTTIVFNGQEYPGVDAMPEDVRRVYLDVMKAVAAREAAPGNASGDGVAKAPARPRVGGFAASSRGPRPIAPESFSARKLIVGAAVLALLAGLYLMVRR